MKQRKYFELIAKIGKKRIPDKDYPYTTEVLLSDMAYARIHGAAVLHHGAMEYSFLTGNKQAIEVANANTRLVSLAAVSPTAAMETNQPTYMTDLLKAGVRGFVNVHGSDLGAFLTPKTMEPMASALMEYQRPLIMTGGGSKEGMKKIDELAQAYPELPIIMTGAIWYYGREFWDIMTRNQNLHFEISCQHINEILERTKQYFGIERVLYSSSWPLKSMGAMKTMVEYADLTEEEKDLVAHGNACRLLGLSADDFALYDDDVCELDSIAKEMDAGVPLSIPVIDPHTHLVEDGAPPNDNFAFGADSKSMAERMKRLGVDFTITAPMQGITIDGSKGNEEIVTANSKYPGKFLGYTTCNLNYEEELGNWETYHKANPDLFVGMKPYPPYQGYSLKGEECAKWLSYANDNHWLVLVHSGCADYSEQVDAIADKYPNATFLLAHSGASFGVARANGAIAQKHDNVLLDITYTSTSRGMIEFMVKEFGADKVVYSSDTPMRDAAPQLGWVAYAKISEEDKKKIFAGNIQKILNKQK